MKINAALRFILIIACLAFIIVQIPAQIEPEEPLEYNYRKYVNREAYDLTIRKFGQLQDRQVAIDKEANGRARGITIKKSILPVVFHIVHNGSYQKISEEQVYSQIEALNRDFSLENKTESIPAELAEGFHNVKAHKLDIEFCLPKSTGKGKEDIGINYLNTPADKLSLDDIIYSSNNFNFQPWDPEKYINIWVVDFEKDITGFAQRPGGPTNTDGVFIDSRFFGTIGNSTERFNEGKTLTHLMGNFLGLKDLWGERNCVDDDISDTPIHSGPNYGCPVYKHISTCSKERKVEMTMNFMDNTDDGCMYMFTIGQMLKMHATIAEGGARHGLLETKTKCNNGNKAQPEQGTTVNLLSQPTTWIFPNPASSEININIKSTDPGHTYIMIYDALGNTVFDKNFATVIGDHIEQIQSSYWSRGVYFIHTKVNDHATIQKIVLTKE